MIQDWTKAATLALFCFSGAAFAQTINTTIVSANPAADPTNSTDIVFEFSSNFSDARFVCSIDDFDPLFCSSPMRYINLADGRHKFRVFAVSSTGGTDAIGAEHYWTIDTVAPATTLSGANASMDSVLINLSSSEANSTFICSIDAGPLQPCQSPLFIQGLSHGDHLLKAHAIDAAANKDPIGALYIFHFEVLLPINTTLIQATPSEEFTSQTSITFDFTSNHPSATFICALNGAAPTPCASPFSYSGLADAAYAFKVQAVDAFGNVDPVGAEHAWTVDTTAPEAWIEKIEPTSTSITITWATNEPATTRLFWGKDGELNREAPDDGVVKTRHTVKITGLSSNSVYSLQPAGRDRAFNPFRLARVTARTLR